MGVFGAIVQSQDALAEQDAGAVFSLVDIGQAEAVERVQVRDPQPFPVDDGPFFVQVLLQEITLVQAQGCFVLRHSRGDLIADLKLVPGLQAFFERFHIQPDLQAAVEPIAAPFEKDDRQENGGSQCFP